MDATTVELHRLVEAFLVREALLLDEGRYEEWLDLLSEDIWYFCPLVECVDGIEPGSATAGSYFDEDKQSLRNRIAWLTSGRAPIETPPSIKRRLVSNIEVEVVSDGFLAVASNFMVWQIRPRQSEGVLFVGRRHDRIGLTDGAPKLVERRIELAHPVLPRALSLFF